MGLQLASESTFRRIAETIISASNADDTFVNFEDSEATTLRFANNQAVQHVSVRAPSVSVRVAFGQKAGGAGTNRLDTHSLTETLRRAERIARVAPEDPEYLSPLPAQRYIKVPGFRDSTAKATPMDLARRTKPVIDKCMRHDLVAAGIMTNRVSVRGVAASTGLFGYRQSTEARFSLTATGEDSSGWTLNAHRDINSLKIGPRTDRAIEKAVKSRNPREIPAGHYTVILEPAAVAGILGPLLWSVSAKSYYKGNSPFVDKLGSVILDTRLTLRTEPRHADLLGSPFGRNGLAARPMPWISNGVLEQLYYDRFTAKEHDVEPTPWPSALILTFDGPRATSVDDLVAQTERGVLITNFWYIRSVDRADVTVTGMTRDGTFLIEDGRIVCGLRNFRFHDSPLRCFRQVDAATAPLESLTLERGKMLLPAVKLPDFYLSSVTKF
jgi:predicted Zn-dependent protease